MKINFTVLGRIGDMIIVTAAFRAIKEKYPDAELHVLAGMLNSSVIENNPDIDKIRILDKSPLKLIKLIRSIRKEKFDYYIDPKDHPSSESENLATLSGAKTKIGFNKPGSKVFRHTIASNTDNYDLHFSQRCINTLGHIGIDSYTGSLRPLLFPAKSSIVKAGKELEKIKDRPTVLINVSASNEDRMLPTEKWIRLIDYIIKSEYLVALNAAPSEKHIADKLKNEFPDIIIPESKSIDEVIALTQLISERNPNSFMITPDTSLVHVASAFNMPTIAIYNGREEVFMKFSPLSDRQVCVKADEGEWSIRNIETNVLINAVKSLLT